METKEGQDTKSSKGSKDGATKGGTKNSDAQQTDETNPNLDLDAAGEDIPIIPPTDR